MKTPKKYRFLIEETQRKREEEEAASLAAAEAINAPDGPVLRPPNRKKRRADTTDDEGGEGGAAAAAAASSASAQPRWKRSATARADSDSDSDGGDISAATAAASRPAMPRPKKQRRSKGSAQRPQTTTGAPDCTEEVQGRQVFIRDKSVDKSGDWVKGLLTGWTTGQCLCDGHEPCGKSNREQLWVEWQSRENTDVTLDVQLNKSRWKDTWMWEENWRDYKEGQLSHEEEYNRGDFLEAPISKVLWDGLSDLMERWGNGQCRINHTARQNRNSFANSWPRLLREQILRCEKRPFLSLLYIKTIFLPRQARVKHRKSTQKKGVFRRLLTKNEVTSEQSRRAGTAARDGAERRDRGTRALKMADPRLHKQFIEEQFNIFDVSDMLELITDLAKSVSAAVNWDDEDEDEAGCLESWIEELRGKVAESIEANKDGYYEGECCAGCLRMASQPDAVRKTPSFEPFHAEHDHFTKTGSGQT
eukprot:COSAG06_NODE_3706_length_4994_cov_5.256588_2_plen_476_part_00